MSSKVLVLMEEYLRTSYEGVDREYLDGEVVERSLPTYLHGKTQLRLGALFSRLSPECRLYPCAETRIRMGSVRVRVPDVAVFGGEEPDEAVPGHPPLIVIEILSPDDRHSEVHAKLEEYRRWGVLHVWLVDPQLRKLYVYNGGLREVAAFELADPAVKFTVAEVFG